MFGLDVILIALSLAGLGWDASEGASSQDIPAVDQAVRVTGIFVVLYADPETLYFIVDEDNTHHRTRVLLDEQLTRAAGGILALRGQRVTVTGLARANQSQGVGPPTVEAKSIALTP